MKFGKELPKLVQKKRNYDNGKENLAEYEDVLEKHVAASAGPHGYSLIQEKGKEGSTNIANKKDIDEANINIKNRPIERSFSAVKRIENQGADSHKDFRKGKSADAKNAKSNRSFKDWQKN